MPLKVSDGIGAYIDDFKKSDAPQFKGKSSEERRDMAIAAYLSAKKGPKNEAMSPGEKAAHDRAIAAFKKRGGKITKLPPGKAAGYHGKDDPGRGMAGMLKRPDTDRFGTRKKIKSMSPLKMSEASMDMKKAEKLMGPSKNYQQAVDRVMKGMRISKPQAEKMVKKILGVNPKTNRIEAAEYPHMMYDPKTGKQVTAKTPADHDKYAKMGYTHDKPKTEAHLTGPLNKKDVPFVKDLVGKLRKGSKTHAKQADDLERAMKTEETNFAVSIEGLPTMFMTADSPGMLKQTLRKIVKQPSMIQSVKRVTDAAVKKTFRLKAQGRDEEDQGMGEQAKVDYGSDESVKIMKNITPGQKTEYHHPQPKQPGLKKVQELLKKRK